MKKGICGLVLLALFALTIPASAEQRAEDILKAVVKLRAVIPQDAHTAATLGTEREGNGIVIDSNGLILTTGYLIIEAERIEITGPEGKTSQGSFVGYDHETGIGLLRAEKPLPVEPMKIGDPSKVEEGDPVLVVGYGGKEAVQGVRVIARKEFAGYWEYILENAIFTAPPYASFGGAALIGRDGRLLGVGSLFSQLGIQGVGTIPCNVFIPIHLLNPILDDLIRKGRPEKSPRPWLGANFDEAHGRIFVTKLTPGGPAEKAGLQADDLILTVNGKTVSGLADFYRKLWDLGDAGVEAALGVLKGTQIREIKVQTSDRYQFLHLKPIKKIKLTL
jgi:S1-C subfamily serine protease